MKILSDLIAVILFFLTYTLTKNIIWATAAALVTGLIQAAFTWIKHKKLDTMQQVSLVLIVVFGGATILFKDGSFIMWKPTLLFWAGAVAIAASQMMKKNGLKALMGKELDLPDAIWKRLAYTWTGFLVAMGIINLAVAYPFTPEREPVWVQYKMYGSTALTLLFVFAQGFYLSRHLPQEKQP
ncbi:MAG: septation protein A [Neisseria sp.]|uniref:septation protein A n=1 Tax=Neisseria sp. TaxID=192066 RepID=UPI0026DCD1F2|nr:septation protein A [Neisseria sp.]MDO4249490.1 septation protein A [Neisseria sp.]